MAFIPVILVITVYTVWRVKLMQIAMDKLLRIMFFVYKS